MSAVSHDSSPSPEGAGLQEEIADTQDAVAPEHDGDPPARWQQSAQGVASDRSRSTTACHNEPGIIHGETDENSYSKAGDAAKAVGDTGDDTEKREDILMGADTGTDAASQVAGAPEGLESRPDSYPESRASDEFDDGCSSDETSELSEGQRIAFELSRAEIRRGKARETSPVLSEGVPLDEKPEPQFSDQSGAGLGDEKDESFFTAAGPAQEPEDPDVVYVPWEKDAGRPLQKLPIRFRDLNGRTYIFPWEKVRTWGRMKGLIRKVHSHQPRLLHMIRDGEYHLLAKNVWANEKDAALAPDLASYPPTSAGDEQPPAGPSSTNPAPPPSDPMVGGRPCIGATRDAIILPEAWDAVVEPGMYVDMVAWHGGPHPVFGLVPPHAGRGRGWAVPAPLPPSDPGHLAHGDGMVNHEATEAQQANMMALARGAWPPGVWPPRSTQQRIAGVAPRKVVKTRVKQGHGW